MPAVMEYARARRELARACEVLTNAETALTLCYSQAQWSTSCRVSLKRALEQVNTETPDRQDFAVDHNNMCSKFQYICRGYYKFT